jgi:hypothetical protein
LRYSRCSPSWAGQSKAGKTSERVLRQEPAVAGPIRWLGNGSAISAASCGRGEERPEFRRTLYDRDLVLRFSLLATEIVDAQTGEVHGTPFARVGGRGSCGYVGAVDGNPLSYRIDSSLLIITGSLEIVDPNPNVPSETPCRRFYYQWDGDKLILLRTVIPIFYAPSK